MEDKEPDYPGDRRSNSEGPEQGRPVEGKAPDLLVGQNCEEQRYNKAGKSNSQGEKERMIDAPIVFRGGEEVEKVLQTYKNLYLPERGSFEDRQTERVKSRPEEKNHNHDHLGSDQEVGKKRILENAFFHNKL
jgi:hypothetical protein